MTYWKHLREVIAGNIDYIWTAHYDIPSQDVSMFSYLDINSYNMKRTGVKSRGMM